jgi:hypothetical protein
MNMGRRIAFGVMWVVAVYVGTRALVGGFSGAIAGARDSQNSYEVGRVAGQQAVERYDSLILAGSILVVLVGTAAGVLPGTKSKSESQKPGRLGR